MIQLLFPLMLFECVVVVVLFLLSRRLAAALGNPAWASPVVLAAVATYGLLRLVGQPVSVFRDYTQPLSWLLGPAVVALGGIVHRNRGVVAAQTLPLLVAVAGGTAAGVGSALWLAHALGLGRVLTAALATKTISTPFAVAVAVQVGGPVPLAAALAVLTGIVGAVIVPPLLTLLRIRGAAVSGIAIGQSAHLVGTDQLIRRDPRAAAWSAVTMVLAGSLAAVALPLLWRWLT